jgi:hypothetical protein
MIDWLFLLEFLNNHMIDYMWSIKHDRVLIDHALAW